MRFAVIFILFVMLATFSVSAQVIQTTQGTLRPDSGQAQATQDLSTPPPQFVPQTQMSMSGDLEVDLKQAKVDGSVLTAILLYRNTGTKVVNVRYSIENVYFIDKRENKKYQVLKDEKGDWIAAPVARSGIGFEGAVGADPLVVDVGEKKSVWFKFPAPPAESTSINLVVPDVIPFEGVVVSR